MASRLQNGLLLAAICLISRVSAMDNLSVAFEWKQLDFAYPSEAARQEAKDGGEFIPENNIPVGLEVFGDRLFVTIPRWKAGVPASLAYVTLTNISSTSPELIPYPNWAAHRAEQGAVPELVSPYRVRADRCGRLWTLDSGVTEILNNSTQLAPPQIVVYDLRTDTLTKRYEIPADQIEPKSFFANIAVEDTSCEDSYAYAADQGSPGLIVYSWKSNESWRIKHHYFHPDPLAGDFTVSGINFQSNDAVLGLGLSGPGADGFSTLYFHPLASTNEFSVSTKILRNKTVAEESFDDFKMLGNRGPNAQSSVEFVDKHTGVLFYALVNLNAVACWKTTNKAYTIESQGRIYMSNVTMVYPNDVKVDDKGSLWVLSDRLPTFKYGHLNPEEVNFRILTASVKDAISGTACDVNVNSIDIINKFKEITNSYPDKLNPFAKSNKSSIATGSSAVFAPALSLILVQLLFVVLFTARMH